MKFSLLTAAGVLAAINQATAVTVVTPWANTVWAAGGHGLISWNFTSAEANLKCDIFMLNGELTNSNIVAHVTNPSTPVDCNVGSYDMYPLNNFASGKYWIRMGQASTGTWAYSSPFQFNGTGTAHPMSVVNIPSATGTSAAATGTVAAAGGAASGKPSVDAGKKAASSTTSGASGTMSINAASVGLGVIAAVALTL